jgi:hypothetical protein
MRIQIDTPDGRQVEIDAIELHGDNGESAVRVDGAVVGTCRWEHDGVALRFFSLPIGTFRNEGSGTL